jgi:hypothetical protein
MGVEIRCNTHVYDLLGMRDAGSFDAVVEALFDTPTASLPGACNGWAETQGAYRLLAQGTFEWLEMLQPLRAWRCRRMVAHPVGLCLQDTASST